MQPFGANALAHVLRLLDDAVNLHGIRGALLARAHLAFEPNAVALRVLARHVAQRLAADGAEGIGHEIECHLPPRPVQASRGVCKVFPLVHSRSFPVVAPSANGARLFYVQAASGY